MEVFTRLNMIKSKDIQQKKALNAWAQAKFKGSVIAGTGFGKTRVGVLAMGKILELHSTKKGIVLVPTTQLQEQFKEEVANNVAAAKQRAKDEKDKKNVEEA